MNPVKRILGDRYSRDSKTIIGSCDYCLKPLYFDGDDRNYIYQKGKYWCIECFTHISRKERNKR